METTDVHDLEARWGRRIIWLIVVLIVAGVGAFGVHRAFFSSGSTSEEPYQPYTVGTMTLRAMITTSGLAVAQDEAVLSFALPGQISDIYVELGDEVKFGQPLMKIKADEQENALAAAESNLAAARLRLRKLLEGATSTELGGADEAVVSARSALTKAENDLRDALDPPTEAELTAAREGVTSAEAALSSAESKLNTLKNGASDAELAAAESSAIQAENNLSQAERAEDAAENTLDNTRSAYEYAGSVYCDTDGHLEHICSDMESDDYEDPLTSDQVDEVLEVIEPEPTPTRTPGPSPTPTPTDTPVPTTEPTPTRTPRPTAEPLTDLEEATRDLVYASTAYSDAITALENAEDSVDSAEAALNAAELALDELQEGASSDDITAAEKAVESAQAGLEASQAALQELIDGPTDTTIANLQAAVDKALTALSSAVTARNDLLDGATKTEIAMQEEDVHQAEIAVEKARDALDDATLTSPFDGIVSALSGKMGQFITSATPAITILTPGVLIFELNIGETELPDLKVGQVGGVIFDAIPGKVYPIRVAAIGLSPEQQQGVIIYKVKTQILGDLGDPSGPTPAPGMNGSASIITQQRADVVAVPSSVIRSRGGEKIVEVVVDGKIETRPVQTGLSDGDNTEIVSGLTVGDTIALRGAAAAGQAKNETQEELPEGIR